MLNDFNANKHDSVGEALNKIFLKNVELGMLIITPYCDFVNNKKNEILYLPVLIVKKREDNKNSFFKSNIKKIDLRNGNLLLYNPSTYCVSDLDDMISETYDYYLDKEYVNEVQINVANSISRIGTTIIE